MCLYKHSVHDKVCVCLSLLSGAGEGEVVSKEVGEEERGARGGVDRRSDNATCVDVEMDPRLALKERDWERKKSRERAILRDRLREKERDQ